MSADKDVDLIEASREIDAIIELELTSALRLERGPREVQIRRMTRRKLKMMMVIHPAIIVLLVWVTTFRIVPSIHYWQLPNVAIVGMMGALVLMRLTFFVFVVKEFRRS